MTQRGRAPGGPTPPVEPEPDGVRARPLVRDSWRRGLAAHVDPEVTAAPIVYDDGEVRTIRAQHPLAMVLPSVRATVGSLTSVAGAGHLLIVTDAQGTVLWREGSPALQHLADASELVEGSRWSETTVGTNAMGTALAVGRPVQVLAGEHLVRRYHAWGCAATPVHDPDTGEVLGTIDITGPPESYGPHIRELVVAAGRLADAELRIAMLENDERLRHRHRGVLEMPGERARALLAPTGRVLEATPRWRWPGRIASAEELGQAAEADRPVALPGGGRAWVEPLESGWVLRTGHAHGTSTPPDRSHPAVPFPRQPGQPPERARWRVGLLGAAAPTLHRTTPDGAVDVDTGGDVGRGDEGPTTVTLRQAELLALLAAAPEGLGTEELVERLHGRAGSAVTVRSEVHRLRDRLGADAVRSGPYRLAHVVDTDVGDVLTAVRLGAVDAAAEAFGGELLPASRAPGVVELRAELATRVRRAVLDADRAGPLWHFAGTPAGARDRAVLERLERVLSRADPRRVEVRARLDRLDVIDPEG